MNRFEEASNTVTALQQRVLSVLTTEQGLTPDEVATAAELGRWKQIRANDGSVPDWQYLGPDRTTARNTLGWLASKGFAQCVTGRWYRTFSVRVAPHNSDTLPDSPSARTEGSEIGQEARSRKSSPPVFRKAA